MLKRKLPCVRMSDGEKFEVDECGVLYFGRRYQPCSSPRESEIRIAMPFLQMAIDAGATTERTSWTSYGVKHVFQSRLGYVSNGSMVVACHRLRIPMKFKKNPNPRIGIKRKWLESQEALDKTGGG